MRLPTLAGSLVELRPLVREDARRVAAIVNDPAVNRTLRASAPVSVATEVLFIEALPYARADLVLGVAARDDGRIVGVTGLHHLDDPARKAELGIFLGPPSEWGRGFGTEATRLLVAHGFGALGLHRIWLHVQADHARAIRAYERVGFRREGLLRESGLREGRPVDEVVMGLLSAEWAAGGGPG